ncbi:helix-turn-helix domain-containing protein [Nocardia beijingensis]
MLGRQLRELRIKSGVSAEYARDAIDVGKQTLWRMETGQPVPAASAVHRAVVPGLRCVGRTHRHPAQPGRGDQADWMVACLRRHHPQRLQPLRGVGGDSQTTHLLPNDLASWPLANR